MASRTARVDARTRSIRESTRSAASLIFMNSGPAAMPREASSRNPLMWCSTANWRRFSLSITSSRSAFNSVPTTNSMLRAIRSSGFCALLASMSRRLVSDGFHVMLPRRLAATSSASAVNSSMCAVSFSRRHFVHSRDSAARLVCSMFCWPTAMARRFVALLMPTLIRAAPATTIDPRNGSHICHHGAGFCKIWMIGKAGSGFTTESLHSSVHSSLPAIKQRIQLHSYQLIGA